MGGGGVETSGSVLYCTWHMYVMNGYEIVYDGESVLEENAVRYH